MSESAAAILSAAMTIAFFYHSLTGGLIFATLLLFCLLRYAPKQMFYDDKKSAGAANTRAK